MLAFAFAITFSSFLSYSVSYYYNTYQMSKEIKRDMLNLCDMFDDIHTAADIPHTSLSSALSTSMYKISVAAQNEIDPLSEEDKTALLSGTPLILSKPRSLNITCYFYSGGVAMKISPNLQSSMFAAFGYRIVIMLSAMMLISAIIMFIAGKSISRPLKDLSIATQKVSEGNFDVQVEVNDEYHSEIAQLAKSFNSMVTELKSNELLRNDFISNVSHEFKTPLATVNGFAKLLQDENCSDDEVKEYASIIESETDRLTVLCSNILKLSKLENQTIQTKSTAFSLDEQIRNAIIMLENDWVQKDIELDLDLEDTHFYGNEELLLQVWLNLLANAIKFSHQGGNVSVVLKNNEDSVLVSVTDNGIGMSEETMRHAFDKFYQGDTAHSTRGNGLGLALVQKIVQISGGTVTVKSKLGEGSCFEVTLNKTEQVEEYSN